MFLPPNEVLSIFPGFVAEWDARESSFDRTYRDLCEALARRPLRGARGEGRGALLGPIEEALGGKVILDDNGKFYVVLPDGKMEAPLVAEGLRKLAMIDYLLVNGTLTQNGFLFWDEPEANLNPKLAHLVGKLVFGLGRLGVQVVLATHDYALASELSMLANTGDAPDAAFFSLSRDATGGVIAERRRSFTDLRRNDPGRAGRDPRPRAGRNVAGHPQMRYEESGFRFTFGPSWQHVERWDTCRGYLDGIGTLNGELDGRAEGTKAVDFVGVRDHEVWLFEIKDFRNRPIEHKVRSNELPLEVALKARDTVAGLIGRHRHDVPEPWIPPVMDGLLDRAASLTVVALIAHPGPWRSLPERQHSTIKDVIMKKTRQRLAWLTRRVYVLDPSDSRRIPDLTVTPLGQR